MRLIAARESSVEASSTRTSSMSLRDWFRILCVQRSMNFSALKTGTTTDTFGMGLPFQARDRLMGFVLRARPAPMTQKRNRDVFVDRGHEVFGLGRSEQ